MKRLLFAVFALLISLVASSQSGTGIPLKGDSVVIYKTGGNSSLTIKNSTKDSLNGVLANIGGGKTGFLKIRAITDSSFIIGTDTVVIRGAAGAVSYIDSSAANFGNRNLWSASNSNNLREYFDSATNRYAFDYVSEFNGWRWHLPASMPFLWDVSGYGSLLTMDEIRAYMQVPLMVNRTGSVPQIGMITSISALPEWETAVYGEVSGGAFGTKWGGEFVSTGGTNNYGIEPIALGGSGNNAALRITQPGTFAANNWSILNLSGATIYSLGPILTGTRSTGIGNQANYQLENGGSQGQNPDSLRTIDYYSALAIYAFSDTTTSAVLETKEVKKVKLNNGPGTPTTNTLGTNVTSATITGHDDAFRIVVVTSGNVNGSICNIAFANTWDAQPYMSNPGFGVNSTTSAATSKMWVGATSTSAATIGGTITGAGTYTFEIISHR